MTLKHVNAVVVGAGAGGGIVAKELAEAGLTVALLERGKWYSPADCRKDDLRNQRTSALGNGFGPDDERNPRVIVDAKGQPRIVLASEGGYNNNAACVGGGTFSYGAMAWRFHGEGLPDALHLRRGGGQHARRLADQLRRPRAVLRKGRVGDRRFGRRRARSVQGAPPQAAAHAAAAAEQGIPDPEARRASGSGCIRSTSPCCATACPTTAAAPACAAAGASASPAR